MLNEYGGRAKGGRANLRIFKPGDTVIITLKSDYHCIVQYIHSRPVHIGMIGVRSSRHEGMGEVT